MFNEHSGKAVDAARTKDLSTWPPHPMHSRRSCVLELLARECTGSNGEEVMARGSAESRGIYLSICVGIV